MKILPASALLGFITELAQHGASAISLVMNTDPKLNKTSRVTGEATPTRYADLRKVSHVNGFLNFDYEKAVNRQLGREGKEAEFKTQSAWFEHVTGDARPIVRHKADHNKVYVQVKSERVCDTQYVLTDGTEIDKDTLAPYLPVPSKPKNQGTEKPILTFTVALDSIVSITAKGETYMIARAAKAPQTHTSAPSSRPATLPATALANEGNYPHGQF